MDYTLLQIESGESLTLPKDYWLEILKTGEKEGWEPEGTQFDFDFEIDEALENQDNGMLRLFSYIVVNNDNNDWQGSYTEHANQIISEPDAYYLFQAIADVINDPPLHAMLQKGNIRICKR